MAETEITPENTPPTQTRRLVTALMTVTLVGGVIVILGMLSYGLFGFPGLAIFAFIILYILVESVGILIFEYLLMPIQMLSEKLNKAGFNPEIPERVQFQIFIAGIFIALAGAIGLFIYTWR